MRRMAPGSRMDPHPTPAGRAGRRALRVRGLGADGIARPDGGAQALEGLVHDPVDALGDPLRDLFALPPERLVLALGQQQLLAEARRLVLGGLERRPQTLMLLEHAGQDAQHARAFLDPAGDAEPRLSEQNVVHAWSPVCLGVEMSSRVPRVRGECSTGPGRGGTVGAMPTITSVRGDGQRRQGPWSRAPPAASHAGSSATPSPASGRTARRRFSPFPSSSSAWGFRFSIRAREQGDIENGSAACGQPVGLIDGVRPVRDAIEAMVDEAQAILARLPSWRGSGRGDRSEGDMGARAPYAGLTDEELETIPTVFRDGLFAGQVVLVSGGAGGIGRAACCLFGRLGASIVACGRDGAKLAGLEAWLGSLGISCLTRSMTIRDPAI